MSLNRRSFVLSGAAAGATLASLPASQAVLAQDKPTVTIGSKNFTESIVLAHICSFLLEDAGYPVERQINLGGTLVAHEAAVNGDIDLYVEYTGTALMAILGRELPDSSSEGANATPSDAAGKDPVYEIVADVYPDEFGLEWLEPWGLNSTYVMAVKRSTAEEHGLRRVSDLQGHASEMIAGLDQEFLIRPDGLEGLEATYDIEFADAVGLDYGLVYSAIDEDQVDIIAATATDGRIAALDLVPLEDDLTFFPPYVAAPVVRQELLDASPEVADVLNQLAGQMDNADMGRLTLAVDEGGSNPVDVAREFLVNEGYLAGA